MGFKSLLKRGGGGGERGILPPRSMLTASGEKARASHPAQGCHFKSERAANLEGPALIINGKDFFFFIAFLNQINLK